MMDCKQLYSFAVILDVVVAAGMTVIGWMLLVLLLWCWCSWWTWWLFFCCNVPVVVVAGFI